MSYWQVGCDHGRAGRPMVPSMRYYGGYSRGYDWGQRQAQRERIAAYERAQKALPDPPLRNPYMEALEAVEGVMARLQTFTKEFPQVLDTTTAADYSSNLLEVRDTLHRFRQAEMTGGVAAN